jgi:hypothetical protein
MSENVPTALGRPEPLLRSDEWRRAALSHTVAESFRHGWRVESQMDFQAVLVSGKPINHVLHLLLTLVTFGLWAIVWILLAITGGEKRCVVSIDPYGNALWQ